MRTIEKTIQEKIKMFWLRFVGVFIPIVSRVTEKGKKVKK